MELAGPLVGIAIQTAITVAITLWARSVRRKHDGLLWRLNVWAAPAGMALWIGGSAVSGILIVRAFDAVQSADAASRATILAQ
ncbi:MAG: hypothetical protein IT378_00065, partial [Sandaracinaceae bacterium]|nr:hypothetical protein [Sandaracinaceae bacterium]